jgi:uncharacterized membrane protein
MEARVKAAGHAVHPILITFPLGLLSTAVLFDVVHLATGTPRWAEVAFWMMASGVIGGIGAAVPGTIDWLGIPRGTRAFRIGLLHGAGNVVVLLFFGASVWLRHDAPTTPSTFSTVLAMVGFVVAGVTGWLGGELIERLGVSVHEHADLDAPNSLLR